MTNSILCTNQARHNGVIVNDIPKIIDNNSPQCITFPNDNVHLPLLMKGPVPILPISKPNNHDLEILPRLQLTSDEVIWDPNSIFGSDYEDLSNIYECSEDYHISGIMSLHDIINKHQINSFRARGKDGKCSASHLSKLWGIGLKAAERTITSTTQLSQRDIRGNISRRVRTKVHQRRYMQLDGYLAVFKRYILFQVQVPPRKQLFPTLHK